MIKLFIMTLKDIYLKDFEKAGSTSLKNNTVISLEVFPPKNDENEEKLEKLLGHLAILKKYNPAFVSLTYGAGGTNQSASLNIIKRIQNELHIAVMPHFTCVCTSKNNTEKYLSEINELGIKKILALRGDIPQGVEQKNFDFKYANELVEFIKSKTNLSVGVAGYPECHIECDNFDFDLINLKRKVDAGADAIFTQMFFDNDKYFAFVENAKKTGINVPVIPGILPIKSFQQLEKMLSMAKVTVPGKLMNELEKHKDNNEDISKIGIEHASGQCEKLIEYGVKGLHFYTLNTSSSVGQILDNIIS